MPSGIFCLFFENPGKAKYHQTDDGQPGYL